MPVGPAVCDVDWSLLGWRSGLVLPEVLTLASALQSLRLRLGLEGNRRPVESFSLPSLGRALLVFAHMDDEINAVGLVSRLRAAGVELDLVVLTDGAANPWTDARVVGTRSHFECRRDELLEATKLLGVNEPVLPGLPDSKLASHLDEAAAVVQRVLEQRSPGLVITFDPKGVNGHPDHMAAHEVTRRALARSNHDAALAMLLPPPPFSFVLGAGFRSESAPAVATLGLTDDELELKARVFDGYRSQQKTLKLLTAGLSPRTFFKLFRAEWYLWLGVEQARGWVNSPPR